MTVLVFGVVSPSCRPESLLSARFWPCGQPSDLLPLSACSCMNTFFSFRSGLTLVAGAALLFSASCTAPRAIVSTGKVTPRGEFRVGGNLSFNVPTETISKAGSTLKSAAQNLADKAAKDSVNYNPDGRKPAGGGPGLRAGPDPPVVGPVRALRGGGAVRCGLQVRLRLPRLRCYVPVPGPHRLG